MKINFQGILLLLIIAAAGCATPDGRWVVDVDATAKSVKTDDESVTFRFNSRAEYENMLHKILDQVELIFDRRKTEVKDHTDKIVDVVYDAVLRTRGNKTRLYWRDDGLYTVCLWIWADAPRFLGYGRFEVLSGSRAVWYFENKPFGEESKFIPPIHFKRK